MANSTLTVAQMEQALVDSKELHEAKTTAEIVAGINYTSEFTTGPKADLQKRLIEARDSSVKYTYLVTGDSTRDADYNLAEEYYYQQLEKINFINAHNALSGLSIDEWLNNIGDVNLNQAISLTSGTGETTIMEFSLGINDYFDSDLTGTRESIKVNLISSINAYKSAKPDALVFLVSPVKTHRQDDYFELIYQEVATELNLFLVSGYSATVDVYGDSNYYVDTTHPSMYGTERLINCIFDKLLPVEMKNTMFVADRPKVGGTLPLLEVESGFYNTGSGIPTDNASWRRTKLVKIPAGIEIKIIHNGDQAHFLLFDENKIFIRSNDEKNFIPTDVGTYYIAFNITSDGATWDALNETPTLDYFSNPFSSLEYQDQETLNRGNNISLGYRDNRLNTLTTTAEINSATTYANDLASRVTAAEVESVVNSANDTGYDIIILAGQSNMVGRYGPIDSTLDATDPRIFQLSKTDGQIKLAQNPLEHWNYDPNHVGLGLNAAKKYLSTLQSETKKILLIPAALGGSGFSNNKWNVGDEQQEYVKTAVNSVIDNYPNSKVVAIFWNQGEADRTQTQEFYAERLTKMLADFKDNIQTARTAPFICAEVASWSTQYNIDIRNATRAIVNHIDNCSLITTSDLTDGGDSLHFDATSLRELGDRYGDALIELLETPKYIQEQDANGHWFLNKYNAGYIDIKNNMTLTEAELAPTKNDLFLRLSGAIGQNGLISTIGDQEEQTYIVVYRVFNATSENKIIAGNLTTSAADGGSAIFTQSTSTLRANIRPVFTEVANANENDKWKFVAISKSNGILQMFVGQYGGNSKAKAAGTNEVSEINNLAVGNAFFVNADFNNSVDVAEFIVFNKSMTTGDINEVYERSRIRLARIGIDIE